jgi:hypothetical protein
VAIRDLFRTTVLGLPARSSAAPSTAARITPQLESPFAPSADTLQAIVWADLTGGEFTPTTRALAMSVPAVARARHLLCGIIASMPLVSLTRDVADAPDLQPTWMQRTDGDLSPWHRMCWTVDDLLFYGWSLWALQRGAATNGSPVLNAMRVPWSDWELDGDGFLKVYGEFVSADQVCLIPGPHGGLLNDSPTIVRMSSDNLRAASNAARNPNPNIDLHYTGDQDMDPTQRDELVAMWAKARQGENGGVGFTNKWVEAKPVGAHNAQLLVEGRNADAVDVARAASVPAAVLDASNAGASLTYETTEGRNQQLLDYGAKFYMDAIAGRLSQDDMVPRGRRSAFDTSQFTQLTPAPTGAPTSD